MNNITAMFRGDGYTKTNQHGVPVQTEPELENDGEADFESDSRTVEADSTD